MIYSDNDLQDLVSVLAHIDKFSQDIGLEPIQVDVSAIRRVVVGCKQDFPYREGISKASAFKLVAHFVCFFIAERPVRSGFPKEKVGNLAQVENHQNAILAFSLARAALKGSKIYKDEGRNVEVVKQAIWLSAHSFRDIIEAIANATPSTHFKVLTVLFEQLVYKTNPELQYGWQDAYT